jgi:hypothetical protein
MAEELLFLIKSRLSAANDGESKLFRDVSINFSKSHNKQTFLCKCFFDHSKALTFIFIATERY